MTAMEEGIQKAGCLDFVEAIHRDHVYPVMYCRIRLAGRFEIGKLKEAVWTSGIYIPELWCSYDFRHDRFVRRGFTLEDIVQAGDIDPGNLCTWDLGRQPQLKITVDCRREETELILGMSHLLSDGAGFLQYLYLLASLYNGAVPKTGRKNRRELPYRQKEFQVQRRTEQTRYGRAKRADALLPCSAGTEYYLVKRTIAPGEFQRLRVKAKQHQVTMNDIFMTAYARVITRMQGRERVNLACPADLRRFWKTEDHGLTVANMTGLYRNVVIECDPKYDFTSTVLKVHIEMELQKSRRRCFEQISLLDGLYSVIPHTVLGKLVRTAYRPLPVSYSNIGVIRHDMLMFGDCDIIDCVITGSYRYSPDFQLTVSTFRDVCTLNCALIGDAKSKAMAGRILDRIVKELLEWES